MCGARIIYRIGGDGRGKRLIENNYCCPKNKGKKIQKDKMGSVENDKIAIPSMSDCGLESDVCAHFGSREYFTIVDVQDEVIAGIKAISNLSPEGQHNCTAPSIT